MLAKDRTNLKIEEIRMHKHHEIHRVKPLMPALCRIRQGKKVINWETHSLTVDGFAPIFPDTCYHLTHYWPAAADIPVASDNPVHYADAIRYNARTPLQGSLLPLTRLV